jgi:succinyl-diaminopimelate desuccinylase
MDIQAGITKELERLLAFAPVTGRYEHASQLLDYVEGQFAAAGLHIARGEHKKYPYLVAGTKSATSSKLLLQAHIDVVPAHDSLFTLTSSNGKLYGRGAYDMLFAAASYLVLVRELSDAGILQSLDLGIMLTSDEEIGGMYGVGELSKTYSCDVCFLPDAGNFKEAAVASKGVIQLRATATGIAGHSSRPADFQNPIVPLAAFVADFEQMYPNADTTQTTGAITQFHSGAADNQVPGDGSLIIDVRYNPIDDPQIIIKAIEEAAAFRGLTIEQLDHGDAFRIEPTDLRFLEFKDVYKAQTGNELGMMIAHGSSDARFFAAKGVPVIMMRPTGGELHGDQEWIKQADLEQFYTILRTYVTKVAGTS